MRRVLADMWGAELTVVERELTLANTTPAMESLRPLAAQHHEKALEESHEAGQPRQTTFARQGI